MVPDDRVSWDVAFPEYSPVRYTADVVISRPPPAWADPDFEYASFMLYNRVEALMTTERNRVIVDKIVVNESYKIYLVFFVYF